MMDSAGVAMPIPSCLADLTPAWFSHALAARFPGVHVSEARTDGFMGYKPNKARFQLSYRVAAGAPPSVVVKGGFKKPDDGQASGLDIGVELELLAYQELVPHLNVRTPDCFFVTFDPERYEGIMVLQDLLPEGAVFLSKVQNLDYAQAAAFLEAQAKFHAPWLNSPAFTEPGPLGPGSNLDQRTIRLHEGYLDRLVRPEYWDKFLALPRGATLPAALRDAGRIAAAQAKMNALHRGAAPTIVHGDEHLGNLYLDAQGRPGFIDWCARREPWVLGFTYFLLSTVDALHRREWERPLLALYLDRLARFGASPPGFEEAWFLYRCTTIFPMLTWLNNSAVWQPEPVNTRNTARAALAVIDHDALRLLGV